MSVESLGSYRDKNAARCITCGELTCKGVRAPLACEKLWETPGITRLEYQRETGEAIAVEFGHDEDCEEYEIEID